MSGKNANAGVSSDKTIECVSFYYKEGKGGENYQKKNKFRYQVPNNEKELCEATRNNMVGIQICQLLYLLTLLFDLAKQTRIGLELAILISYISQIIMHYQKA